MLFAAAASSPWEESIAASAAPTVFLARVRALRASKRSRAAAARSSTPARDSGFAATATSAMQSTGQGGRQSSQPVHSAAITVCMRFAAPTIASTGQAWMHFVQPMQTSSSMTATIGGASTP